MQNFWIDLKRTKICYKFDGSEKLELWIQNGLKQPLCCSENLDLRIRETDTGLLHKTKDFRVCDFQTDSTLFAARQQNLLKWQTQDHPPHPPPPQTTTHTPPSLVVCARKVFEFMTRFEPKLSFLPSEFANLTVNTVTTTCKGFLNSIDLRGSIHVAFVGWNSPNVAHNKCLLELKIPWRHSTSFVKDSEDLRFQITLDTGHDAGLKCTGAAQCRFTWGHIPRAFRAEEGKQTKTQTKEVQPQHICPTKCLEPPAGTCKRREQCQRVLLHSFKQFLSLDWLVLRPSPNLPILLFRSLLWFRSEPFPQILSSCHTKLDRQSGWRGCVGVATYPRFSEKLLVGNQWNERL